jgi:hypothetical protein
MFWEEWSTTFAITLNAANSASLIPLFIVFLALALAQNGSPFQSGFNSLQNLSTERLPKLPACAIGGYMFAKTNPVRKQLPAPQPPTNAKCR